MAFAIKFCEMNIYIGQWWVKLKITKKLYIIPFKKKTEKNLQ